MQLIPRLAGVLFLCSCGFGCSALNLQRPTASVTGFTVGDVTAQGSTLHFDVAVANPNGVALPLSAADYDLALGGVSALKGRVKPDGSIPAKGSRTVTVPVSFTYENLLAAESAIRAGGGDVPFDLDGGLSFDTGVPVVGGLRVPLRYSGTIPLRQILSNPQALLESPAAKKLAADVLGGLFRR